MKISNFKNDFINNEFEFYANLNKLDKTVWLLRFSFYLTLEVREILYNYRQENIIEDVKVDAINDVQMEISIQVTSLIKNKLDIEDKVIFSIFEDKLGRFNFDFSQFIKDVRMRVDCQ
ncbi:hypothetical protein [Acinetobacter bereziniae]|uniref:hypothetical protein n=1 Tax=Acinetobacter bereziniae TaxID=106648 RepID=UPI003009066E